MPLTGTLSQIVALRALQPFDLDLHRRLRRRFLGGLILLRREGGGGQRQQQSGNDNGGESSNHRAESYWPSRATELFSMCRRIPGTIEPVFS